MPALRLSVCMHSPSGLFWFGKRSGAATTSPTGLIPHSQSRRRNERMLRLAVPRAGKAKPDRPSDQQKHCMFGLRDSAEKLPTRQQRLRRPGRPRRGGRECPRKRAGERSQCPTTGRGSRRRGCRAPRPPSTPSPVRQGSPSATPHILCVVQTSSLNFLVVGKTQGWQVSCTKDWSTSPVSWSESKTVSKSRARGGARTS